MSVAQTTTEALERFEATHECEECGNDVLIVERGGGIISVSCPACQFGFSAPEWDIGEDIWEQFLQTVESLEPEDRKPFIAFSALGLLARIGLFIAAILLNAVDGGRKGLGR